MDIESATNLFTKLASDTDHVLHKGDLCQFLGADIDGFDSSQLDEVWRSLSPNNEPLTLQDWLASFHKVFGSKDNAVDEASDGFHANDSTFEPAQEVSFLADTSVLSEDEKVMQDKIKILINNSRQQEMENSTLQERSELWKTHARAIEVENSNLQDSIERLKTQHRDLLSSLKFCQAERRDTRLSICSLQGSIESLSRKCSDSEERLRFVNLQLSEHENAAKDSLNCKEELLDSISKLQAEELDCVSPRTAAIQRIQGRTIAAFKHTTQRAHLKKEKERMEAIEDENEVLKQEIRNLQESNAHNQLLLQELQDEAELRRLEQAASLVGHPDSPSFSPLRHAISNSFNGLQSINSASGRVNSVDNLFRSLDEDIEDVSGDEEPHDSEPLNDPVEDSDEQLEELENKIGLVRNSLCDLGEMISATVALSESALNSNSSSGRTSLTKRSHVSTPSAQAVFAASKDRQLTNIQLPGAACRLRRTSEAYCDSEIRNRQLLQERKTILQSSLAPLSRTIEETLEPIEKEKELRHSLQIENQSLLDQLANLRRKEEESQLEIETPLDEEEIFSDVPDQVSEEIDITPTKLNSQIVEQLLAFGAFFNHYLAKDRDLSRLGILPIKEDANEDEFAHNVLVSTGIDGGIVLGKLVMLCDPELLTYDALNIRQNNEKPLNASKLLENVNTVLSGSMSLGIPVHVTADMLKHSVLHPEAISGLVSQLIHIYLVESVNLKKQYNVLSVITENIKNVRNNPRDLLLHWVSYHCKSAGYSQELSNFHEHFTDGVALWVLVSRLCSPDFMFDSDASLTALELIQSVFNKASLMGVPLWVKAQSLMTGNYSLTLYFIATLFHTNHGIQPADNVISKQDRSSVVINPLEMKIRSSTSQMSREEKFLTRWLNFLGLPESCLVYDLFEDLKSGSVFLHLLDRLQPDTVDWRKIPKRPPNTFQKVVNCNYVIELVNSRFKLPLVGMGGKNIADGDTKMVLSLLQQLRRKYVIGLIPVSDMKRKIFTDAVLLEWANNLVAANHKTSSIKSFRDRSLSSCWFYIDLLWCIKPSLIDWDLVHTESLSEENCIQNAKYVLLVARKLGIPLFFEAQDLVDIDPHFGVMFVASLMRVHRSDTSSHSITLLSA